MLPILSLHIKLNITCNSSCNGGEWGVDIDKGRGGPCSGRRASTLVGNGRCVAKKVLRVLASLPKFRLLLDNVGAIRTRIGADWEYFLQVAYFLSAFLLSNSTASCSWWLQPSHSIKTVSSAFSSLVCSFCTRSSKPPSLRGRERVTLII